jgi:hypothetical protein
MYTQPPSRPRRDGWHHFETGAYSLWRNGIVRGLVGVRDGGAGWNIEWGDEDGVQQGAGVVEGTSAEAKAAVEKELG